MRIDAVITWVDGADPTHRAARARFFGTPQADDDARFMQTGEIYVAIATILKFAPFLDRIFVVTDNQVPPLIEAFAACGLCAPDRIRIVAHDTIFAGLPAARPNFNSRAIEAVLHRIPDLSDHFVYLNDDMGFNRAARPGDLFDGAGRPQLTGDWLPFSEAGWKTRIKTAFGMRDTRPSHRIAQETGARLMGRTDRFLRVPHCPHPLRVATMREILDTRPGLLERQVGFRFRDRTQYNPVALANHAEIDAGAPVSVGTNTAYVRTGRDFDRTLRAIRDGTEPYFCVQGLESMPPQRRTDVIGTLLDKVADHLPDAIQHRFFR